MKKIIDNVIGDFDNLNEYARKLSYEGVENPADGVTYPDISTQVPEPTLHEIKEVLEKEVGHEIRIGAAFFRLTTKNTEGDPHQAHNDTAMGRYSFMLYMQDGPGGTALVRHKATGLDRDPWTPREWEAWRDDTNREDAWEITYLADMKANRGFLFDSKLMHRAEPVGGFGNDASDGRLVLTVFFN